MKHYIFLLFVIPFFSFSQSGISISGTSQFHIGEAIIPLENAYKPIAYDQRNNNVTISIFRGRKFSIGTIAFKGSVSYRIEKTKYNTDPIDITNYSVIKRSLVPSLEVWYILFQRDNIFLYASTGSYGIIQNLNIEETASFDLEQHTYEYNSIVPFFRTGMQLNYNRFFMNPFISFDLEKIDFSSFTNIFEVDFKEKIRNHNIRTGIEFGIMF